MATAVQYAVMGSMDLLQIILQLAELSPSEFVMASRVSKEWRTICQRDGSLVLGAAKGCHLTKQVLMGLTALTSVEADLLPREKRFRKRGGYMFLYEPRVVDEAWSIVGGVGGWRGRLSKRSRDQYSVETAFGPNWRKLQWHNAKQAYALDTNYQLFPVKCGVKC
jgi:hypothetical protein